MNNTRLSRAPILRCALASLAALLFLGASPGALAQEIGWSPESMFFEDVPINTTEFKTLTLRNYDDSVVPLEVGNIEWTFNQIGIVTGLPQFAFEADQSVPATLLPGETMEIYISFTPEEAFSFASANLLVTNTSINAASLNYWIEGSGSEADVCFPFSNCAGTCTDLQNDLNNCGSCGTVCPIPSVGLPVCEAGVCGYTCDESIDLSSDPVNCGICGNTCDAPTHGTAFCEDGNCGFVCDDGYEAVGDECNLINDSIIDLVNGMVDYWDAAIEEPPTIVGFGPGQSAEPRRSLFEIMLFGARESILDGNYDWACEQLQWVYYKSDGGYPFVLPPDFLAGEGVPGLNERILAVVEKLDELRPEGCYLRDPKIRPSR